MIELIAYRALQGIGGGGLMIGAQAIIGDVVSPRERGRYQGIFGAVFGVTSVAGPLLGGFFVENLSWRWVFYINLPIGVVALVVIAAVLPCAARTRVPHGSTTSASPCSRRPPPAWCCSPPSAAPPARGVSTGHRHRRRARGAPGRLRVVERRAAEPVFPLRLFRNRVFAVSSAVGFVVGFAMFGAITYLPQYLQVVKGVSPTGSGLQLLPMMVGLLLTSIGSGHRSAGGAATRSSRSSAWR